MSSPILLAWRGVLTFTGLVLSPVLFPLTLVLTLGTILIPIASYAGEKERVQQKANQSSVTAFLYGFYKGSSAILDVFRLCFGKRKSS